MEPIQSVVSVGSIEGAPANPELLAEKLRSHSMFAPLPLEQVRAVAGLMRARTFAAGDAVFRLGDPPEGLYFLEHGRVLMYGRIGDQRQNLLDVGPCNMLCGSGILKTTSRHNGADALEPCTVWTLDHRGFEALKLTHRSAALDILRAAVAGMAESFGFSLPVVAGHAGLELAAPAPKAVALPAEREISSADEPLLKVVPALRDLSADAFARLREVARLREAPRGQLLFNAGAPPGELVMLIRGAIEASLETPQGRVRLALRGPGGFAGHEAVFSAIPQPLTVVVKEKALLLTLDAAVLERLRREGDALAFATGEWASNAIAHQFNAEYRELVRRLAERGSQALISIDEMRGA